MTCPVDLAPATVQGDWWLSLGLQRRAQPTHRRDPLVRSRLARGVRPQHPDRNRRVPAGVYSSSSLPRRHGDLLPSLQRRRAQAMAQRSRPGFADRSPSAVLGASSSDAIRYLTLTRMYVGGALPIAACGEEGRSGGRCIVQHRRHRPLSVDPPSTQAPAGSRRPRLDASQVDFRLDSLSSSSSVCCLEWFWESRLFLATHD